MPTLHCDPTELPRDLTDPAQGPRAPRTLLDDLVGALGDAWRVPARTIRRGPAVPIEDHDDRLGYPPDARSRDARHDHRPDETRMLRGSTTAMIPPTLRELADEPVGPPSRVLLAAPGTCHRRDSVDGQHPGTPHRTDLWRLDAGRSLDIRDLVEMIGIVVAAALPGTRWRTVPTSHPYTSHGRRIDVRHDRGWVEIGECGLASCALLAESGLAEHTGLAMGLGLDRILGLREALPVADSGFPRPIRSGNPQTIT